MARHTILLALLAALVLLVAHTTATREQKEHEDSSCHKQLESLELKHCVKHLMKRIQKEEDEDEDDNNVLMMRGINYIRNSDDGEEGQKERCCDQLSRVNILDCRCEAMKEIMDSLSDRLQKKEMKDAEKELMGLPLRCGIAPPLQCDLRGDD